MRGGHHDKMHYMILFSELLLGFFKLGDLCFELATLGGGGGSRMTKVSNCLEEGRESTFNAS